MLASNNATALRPRRAVCFSSGIRSLRNIGAFLDVDEVIAPLHAGNSMSGVESVIVWGRKSNTAAAKEYAKRNNLPLIYLEDGWLRTSSLNAHTRSCYSLLIDHTGVYYDVSQPSDIESLLNQNDDEFAGRVTIDDERYARKCMQQLVANNITKYNYCASATVPLAQTIDKPVVLVVDQTRDDASVVHGAMNEARFLDMLDAACGENPEADVIVRTHPDVVNGKKRGYLLELAKRKGLAISAGGTNPMQVVKQASRVYVGTSQLGYEALLCGVDVSVFGKPFYAGWGLTDDRQPIAHRKRRRSLEQLFHVSHVQLARYINPATGERWQLHQCLEHIQLQQYYFKQNAKRFLCAGIAPWKRRYIEHFLRSPDGNVRFGRARPTDFDHKVTWSFRTVEGAPSADSAEGITRIEDGFIRSSGLGSDFNAPGSLVVDNRGLYFDPSRLSDLEHLLNNRDLSVAEISRGIKLKKLILSAGLSKYNVGESVSTRSVTNKARVLVIGQVEDDQSIAKGCERVNTNASLLEAVRAGRPDAWITYKSHPDVMSGNRKGHVSKTILTQCADAVECTASIIECIEQCDELHTMTSLAGFEALMRGKPVVTYGAPFYSGWGLTTDHQNVERRTRLRTLDELIYLTLIEYPRYLDLVSGEFIKPEDLVKTIINQKDMNNKKRPDKWSSRQLVKAANIFRGLRYAP
ncbi:MAG: capsular polysaccharide biosynthesis protein [Granulosicoccaceae bacterium]